MPSTISFPNMFDASSGKVKTVSGETSYRQCLKSVFLTNIGELLGDVRFGCDLKSALFEIQSPMMQQFLKESISVAANKYVPQVVVRSTTLNTSDVNSSNISIVVNYYTIDTGETDFIELVVLPDNTLTTR